MQYYAIPIVTLFAASICLFGYYVEFRVGLRVRDAIDRLKSELSLIPEAEIVDSYRRLADFNICSQLGYFSAMKFTAPAILAVVGLLPLLSTESVESYLIAGSVCSLAGGCFGFLICRKIYLKESYLLKSRYVDAVNNGNTLCPNCLYSVSGATNASRCAECGINILNSKLNQVWKVALGLEDSNELFG